jgi:predicted Fe-Mo cluster-binding NifX family protein
MIIAVACAAGNVSAHFVSSDAFLVAKSEEGSIRESAVYQAEGWANDQAAVLAFLQEHQVDTVLAGALAYPMQQALKQAGFVVYSGMTGEALGAVEDFLGGDVEPSEKIITHHHGPPWTRT